MSALWNTETCLGVGKRRRVAALQIRTPPGFEQTCLRPRGWQLIGLMLTQDDIKNALAAVKYPGYSRDIVSFGLVKEISVSRAGSA